MWRLIFQHFQVLPDHPQTTPDFCIFFFNGDARPVRAGHLLCYVFPITWFQNHKTNRRDNYYFSIKELPFSTSRWKLPFRIFLLFRFFPDGLMDWLILIPKYTVFIECDGTRKKRIGLELSMNKLVWSCQETQKYRFDRLIKVAVSY